MSNEMQVLSDYVDSTKSHDNAIHSVSIIDAAKELAHLHADRTGTPSVSESL